MDFIDAILTRSFENPATSLADPAEWLSEMLGGGTTETGITINRKTALSYSPIWRGVNLIARDTAKLPFLVYKRLKPMGKERAPEHPAYWLLDRKANDRMTAYTFRLTLTAHALLQGSGYGYVFRRGDGTPHSLAVLDPDVTYPLRVNGTLWYITTVDGKDRKLRPHNVIHIKGLGYDGLTSYSVLDKAKEELGIGIATRKHVSQFFGHGAQPSVVIEHPENLSETALKNIRDSFERIYSGIDNRFRVAVIDEGMKLNPWSVDPQKAQLLESRQFEVRVVANWLGIPPHKLGDDTRTSYASLEQENQAYLDDGLDPWLRNWETECWDKLLTEDEKRNDVYIVEFLRAAMIRTNMKDRYEALYKATGGPWMSRDETRAIENMNPTPDGQGTKLLLPAGVLPVDAPKAAPDSQQGNQRLQAAHRLMLIQALNRMAKRIGLHARREARKGATAFIEWRDNRFQPDHFIVVEAAIAPCIAARLALGGGDVATISDEVTRRFFARMAEDFAALDEYPDEHLVGNVNDTTAAFPTTVVEPLVTEFEEQNYATVNTET